MSDKPIIFSGPMVRALLDGRKTQTRRVIKDVPMHSPEYDRQWHVNVLRPGGACPDAWSWWSGPPHGQSCYHIAKIPYARGDCLWVREAHALRRIAGPAVWYREGHEEACAAGPRVDLKWRPSIHMPRWASRLTLIVEDVKVERLQEISREDVIAEGIAERDGLPIAECVAGWHEPYAALWDALHGAGAWEANPWVVALTFRVVKQNIDAVCDGERG